MPNELLSDMEFEQRLNEFGDNELELLKFLARQQYHTSKLCPIHSKEIKALQNRDNKMMGIVGGIGAFVGWAISAVINYFTGRG